MEMDNHDNADDDDDKNRNNENVDDDADDVVEKSYNYVQTFSSLASSSCPLSAMMTCLDLSSVFFNDWSDFLSWECAYQ